MRVTGGTNCEHNVGIYPRLSPDLLHRGDGDGVAGQLRHDAGVGGLWSAGRFSFIFRDGGRVAGRRARLGGSHRISCGHDRRAA